jgi:hypothetical protein
MPKLKFNIPNLNWNILNISSILFFPEKTRLDVKLQHVLQQSALGKVLQQKNIPANDFCGYGFF